MGCLLGPLLPTNLHNDRVTVIPKGHTPESWRLITDLFFSHEHSMNDGIDLDICSMSYVTVDTVEQKLASLGPGTLMAKVDFEAAD